MMTEVALKAIEVAERCFDDYLTYLYFDDILRGVGLTTICVISMIAIVRLVKGIR